MCLVSVFISSLTLHPVAKRARMQQIVHIKFRCWLISNVTISIKCIAYIFVTWRLEALHQGDQKYCQCQRSKTINGNKKELFCLWQTCMVT